MPDKVPWLLVTTVVAVTPTILIKRYATGGMIDHYLFWLAMFMYLLLGLCYTRLYLTGELATTFTKLHMLEIMLVAVVAVLVFRESMDLTKLAGITFALIALWLLR